MTICIKRKDNIRQIKMKEIIHTPPPTASWPISIAYMAVHYLGTKMATILTPSLKIQKELNPRNGVGWK
jgi:hypothetical protein